MNRSILATTALLAVLGVGSLPALGADLEKPVERIYSFTPPAPESQTPEQAAAKTDGCMTCHTEVDEPTMHANPGVVIGCTDCHGGDASVERSFSLSPDSAEYRALVEEAHVLPRFLEGWNYPSSANPERTYNLIMDEAPEYVRFINPSDYRVAREACGACHLPTIQAAERSLMSTGAMLWGGAAYNNGILPFKRYITGAAYTRDGKPALLTTPGTIDHRMKKKGVLPKLVPLPSWETVPAVQPFRVFEHGGRNIVQQFPEIGNPNILPNIQRLEEPGRPDIRQSNRNRGTGLRISIPILNITKTRLNDPFMWMLGTNDQPGDYRTSGCGGCHVVYANDRDPRHSGQWAQYGHWGESAQADPTIPRDEPGHPVKHSFTRSIPTSQCIVCHMHQPNMFLNTYLGYTMWDYESDAPLMWPEEQQYPTIAELREAYDRNPEEAVARGKWADLEFLSNVWTDINPQAKDTQFADYHGHGWNFRAVYKRDRAGNLLNAEGDIVPNDDPDKFDEAVHMSSIHVDVGMHCSDCHFSQDSHGNGFIYGEVADAIEIGCKDCHGTASAYPDLRTSNPAAPPGGTDLSTLRNPDGQLRFEWIGDTLIQRSIMDPDLEWEMSLVKDTVDPEHETYNAKSARAKLMSTGTDFEWGEGIPESELAHQDEDMTCYTCHLSWTTSCGGCHLPIQANWLTKRHHYERGISRNWASYNPQVARDQMFQLGKHDTTKDNITAPVRSSSALVLSSQNINRERIYIQQPPVAASGYSSQAFAPHFPHTARKTETKTCTDCHLSEENDNNAIMAQLLLLGTNFVNFVGWNAWVGGDGGIEAVNVTEWDEPQAVIGSYLHKYAYPDWYADHQERGKELQPILALSSNHEPGGITRCIQLRGEYVLAAQGSNGTTAYDVASISNKGISDRILDGPISPFGQSLHIDSPDATCAAFPTNQPVSVERNQGYLMRFENLEQPFHPIYKYAFITDSVEGLILTETDTLVDQEPRNNFFERVLTWNENGILDGARHITIAGHIFYIAADAGLVVLDMDDPLNPMVTAVVPMEDVRSTSVQFRYLFAIDGEGMKVFDVTHAMRPRLVEGAEIPFQDAHRVYLARTYAYVAAGPEGLVIVDIENPEQPEVYQRYTANGLLNDARDVVVATTNASLFAYVADGANGLKVLQLTSPDSQPNFYGFSPEPKPELIAWKRTEYPALALSKGLDRDRAVDETGGQIAVFGRLGSRPFNLAEMQELYLDDAGRPWFVTDEVRMQDRR